MIEIGKRTNVYALAGWWDAYSRVINGVEYDFQRCYSPSGEVISLMAVNLKTGEYVHNIKFGL